MSQLPFDITSLKILIADEHDLIRKSIARIFQKLGCEAIEAATTGRSAKKLIETVDYDLVILNLYYSDIDGFALIDQVKNRETKSDIPILVLSGDSEKEEIIKAIDKGATSYIIVPFQPEDLKNTVLKALISYFSPSLLTKQLRSIEDCINNGDYEKAELQIEGLRDRETAIPALGYFEALIAKERGEVSVGVALLQKQITVFPNFLKNYRLLVTLYLELNDLPAAIQTLQGELKINPKNIMRQIKIAHLLTQAGSFTLAAEHLRQALLENNKDAEALFSMAIALAKNNNLEKALYYLKRYRRVYPKDSRPLKAMVQFCSAAKKEKLAELALRDEIKAHPERPDAPVFLAQFYNKQEKTEEAITVLKTAMGHHPKTLRLYYELAIIHIGLGQNEAAQMLFHRYRRVTKDLSSYVIQAQMLFDHKLYQLVLDIVHTALMTGYNHKKFLSLLNLSSAHVKNAAQFYFIQRKIACLTYKDSLGADKACLKALQHLETLRRRRTAKANLNHAS